MGHLVPKERVEIVCASAYDSGDGGPVMDANRAVGLTKVMLPPTTATPEEIAKALLRPVAPPPSKATPAGS